MIEVIWFAGVGTGEGQQRFEGMKLVRMSTGEELFIPKDSQKRDPTARIQTIGFYSTTQAVGEEVYIKVPDETLPNYAVGEPYWAYTVVEADGSVNWNDFNPGGQQSYRDINEPHGFIILAHALGLYPNIPGSKFAAMKRYFIRARQVGWPGVGAMDYPFNSTVFIRDFWDAHAATLGIT